MVNGYPCCRWLTADAATPGTSWHHLQYMLACVQQHIIVCPDLGKRNESGNLVCSLALAVKLMRCGTFTKYSSAPYPACCPYPPPRQSVDGTLELSHAMGSFPFSCLRLKNNNPNPPPSRSALSPVDIPHRFDGTDHPRNSTASFRQQNVTPGARGKGGSRTDAIKQSAGEMKKSNRLPQLGCTRPPSRRTASGGSDRRLSDCSARWRERGLHLTPLPTARP